MKKLCYSVYSPWQLFWSIFPDSIQQKMIAYLAGYHVTGQAISQAVATVKIMDDACYLKKGLCVSHT